jgi:hypothetical protein
LAFSEQEAWDDEQESGLRRDARKGKERKTDETMSKKDEEERRRNFLS